MIDASVPVLYGSGRTQLRVDGTDLLLARPQSTVRVPFAAVASIAIAGRAVEIRLTGEHDGSMRVENVPEAAAVMFVDAVTAALPAERVPHGEAIVTTEFPTVDPVDVRKRKEARRFVLSLVGMVVLACVFGFINGMRGFTVVMAMAAVVGAAPLAWLSIELPWVIRRWRLPRRGITVAAVLFEERAGSLVYSYADNVGYQRSYSTGYTPAKGPTYDVSYDPRDPSIVVAADGSGRGFNLFLVTLAALWGIAVYGFLLVAPWI